MLALTSTTIVNAHTKEKLPPLSIVNTTESYVVPNRIVISYQDFDITKFRIEDPIEMLAPRGNGTYYRCVMTYDGKPFALKMPDLQISIINRDSPNGRVTGLFMGFPNSILSPNDQKFIQVLESIYQSMIPYVDRHKNTLKLPSFDIQFPGCYFKSPLYRYHDIYTGKLLDYKNPYFGLKVNQRTEYNCLREATFLRDGGQRTRDFDLEDLETDMIIHDAEISLSGYVGGGKASIPLRLLRGNVNQ